MNREGTQPRGHEGQTRLRALARDNMGSAIFFFVIAGYGVSNAALSFCLAWEHYGEVWAMLVLLALLFDAMLALPLSVGAVLTLVYVFHWPWWAVTLYVWPALGFFWVIQRNGGSMSLMATGLQTLREGLAQTLRAARVKARAGSEAER